MIDFVAQSLVEKLQYVIAARADAEPFFNFIRIDLVRPRANAAATDIIGKLNLALNTVSGRNGKGGAAVMVNMPVVTCTAQNGPAPELKAIVIASVYENTLFNMGANGTGQSAESIAIALAQLIHGFIPAGVCSEIVLSQRGLVPRTSEGKVIYDIFFEVDLPLAAFKKVPTPTLSLDGDGKLVAKCSFAMAQIYVTTDGSHPYAGNTAAVLYADGAIPVPTGSFILAAAYWSPLAGSDTALLTT